MNIETVRQALTRTLEVDQQSQQQAEAGYLHFLSGRVTALQYALDLLSDDDEAEPEKARILQFPNLCNIAQAGESTRRAQQARLPVRDVSKLPDSADSWEAIGLEELGPEATLLAWSGHSTCALFSKPNKYKPFMQLCITEHGTSNT